MALGLLKTAGEKQTAMDVIMYPEYTQGVLAKKLEQVRILFEDLMVKKEIMPLYELTEYVINRVGIKEAIGKKTEEDENRQLNVDDFLLSVKEYSDSNTTADLEEFLQGITLMRDIDSMNDEDDYASVITVHAAKGLHILAASRQTGGGIFQLRQLDLHLTLGTDGVQRKNIQNQHGAVQHTDVVSDIVLQPPYKKLPRTCQSGVKVTQYTVFGKIITKL